MKRVKQGVIKLRHMFKAHRVIGVVVLAVVVAGMGGGAYAALGGAGRQPAAGDIDLQKSLAGWWKMDGNAKDSSPRRNLCVITGATLTTDREGKANSAYNFVAASTQRLKCGSVGMPTVNTAQSYSAWVYIPTASGYAVRDIMTSIVGATAANQFRITAAGALQMSQFGGGISMTGTGVLSTNTWHLATMTFDGTTMKLYLDGTLDATATPTLQTGTPTNVYIGTFSTSEFWDGKIDDARFYSRALSAGEVAALYAGYNPSTNLAQGEKSLISWLKMDGDAKDASPNRRNGTVTAATLTTDREGKANSAYSFNGTTAYVTIPNLSTSTNNITYMAWIYPNGTQDPYDGIMYSRVSTSPIGIHYSSGGDRLTYTWNNASSLTYNWTGGPTITPNTWNLIALTIDSTQAIGYAWNGTTMQANANVLSHISQTINGVTEIGQDSGAGTRFFNGKIDDARIYNRTLTAAEIQAVADSYKSGVTVSDLQKGLVGYWPFNGNAKDSTPFRNSASVTSATLTTDLKGRANSAYGFVGASSNTITVPDANSLSPAAITSSAWVYPSSAGANGSYQIAAKNGNSEWRYRVNKGTTNGTITVFDRGATNALSTSATIPNDTWSFVAFTGNASGISIYINGILSVSGGTAWGPPNTSGTLTIGSYMGGSEFITGSIDELRVYSRALSAAEIKALYNSYK